MNSKTGMVLLQLGLGLILLSGSVFGALQFFEIHEIFRQIAMILLISGIVSLLLGVISVLVMSREPHGIEKDDVNHSMISLIRCMIAVSVSDNELDAREIDKIRRIYKVVNDEEISSDLIVDVASSMMGEQINIGEELSNVKEVLSKTMKTNIIKAVYMIMIADGKIEQEEEETIEEIRKSLGVSSLEAKKIRENIMKD